MTEEHVVERIRQRVLLEAFNLEPVATPAPSRAAWPVWTEQDKQSVRLRVLSLNAWGLPVAPKCTERAAEIASAISSDYELVVLQEIWHLRERNLVIAKAQQSGFHYYHYFNPAVGFPFPMGADSFGTGLLVLSKFPISSALYHSFSLSGRPYALHESDFVANKGVGLLRVETPAGQIDVYVTHLLANYNAGGKPGPGDFYLWHRTGQSYELTQFIAATNRNKLTIVCGDFNSSPDCLELKVPRQLLNLRDAFTDTNAEDGLTFASPDNKYSHGEHPMRMDYVMYKIDKQPKGASDWHLVKSSIFKGFFTDAHGEKTPLSDHFGVRAEFIFSEPRPHVCEQQERGYDVVSTDEVVSPNATRAAERSCPTTTCAHCDEKEAPQSEEDKAAADAACLQEVQNMLFVGRNEAIGARHTRLWRAVAFFVAALAVFVTHMMSIVVSNWSWVAVLLFGMISVTEYVLTFFFLTFECSTFTELINQVQLHLNDHAQRTRAMAQAKGPQ
ncbi:sphingomyelin phosphodiesterase-like protein [Phytophthora sojae]|uniref:Sphingomyelin phosphodiesterase-like protein n=1 Tax=Phytophthora sojae (strain P6497) TaxID=1094619 RepID=G5A342_PHYSP|nr:sphingomyelin phosphodiesterase-like protein [Phytophthora sojae]EGZ10082.1 sphingomyelin phosphodiesterase-like protein [Phytophthora sojae]|eukprot:XP_009534943.1 sphingomyelin phosphodiesterase-like protein [Phytophthora sojae]